MRDVLLLAAAVFSMGCSVVSPPPLMPHLAGTAPNEPGDMRILLVAGLGAGVWLDGGFGAELRVESQVNEWATLGGGLSVAHNLDDPDPEYGHPAFLFAARTFGRFNPGELDWLALQAGVGITGSDKGTVAFTLDGAPILGVPFELGKSSGQSAWRLTPYAGPVAALSVPLRQGTPITRKQINFGFAPDMHTSSERKLIGYTTTYFVGARWGLAVDSPGAPAWTGALEMLMLGAFSSTDSAALFAIATGQGARFRP